MTDAAGKTAKNDYKFNVLDILLILSLVLQDVGTWEILPLNAFQIIVLIMGLFEMIFLLRKRPKLIVPYRIMMVLSYVGVVTFINYFDFESVKSYGYICIELMVLALYYFYEKNVTKILFIIYLVAAILAFYGMLQELGYILKMPALYAPSYYGFHRFYETEIGGGLIAIYSLYAEPAHLASIFCAALFIGTYKDPVTGDSFSFIKPVITLLVLVASILTGSATVYIGLAITITIIILLADLGIKKKIIVFSAVAIAVLTVFALNRELYESILISRILGLINEFYIVGNMTTFAICSNIRVAIAKMKDGFYFGTGLDSNRLYYYDYVDRLYGNPGVYCNADDAAGLFTRIFSEFGIVGLVLTVGYLCKRLIYSIRRKETRTVITLSVFFIQALRDGSYANILVVLLVLFIMYPRNVNWKRDDQSEST